MEYTELHKVLLKINALEKLIEFEVETSSHWDVPVLASIDCSGDCVLLWRTWCVELETFWWIQSQNTYKKSQKKDLICSADGYKELFGLIENKLKTYWWLHSQNTPKKFPKKRHAKIYSGDENRDMFRVHPKWIKNLLIATFWKYTQKVPQKKKNI